MFVKIYQIRREKDVNSCMFMSYNYTLKQNNGKIPEELYKEVFSENLDYEDLTLDDIYYIFNMSCPKGFIGHSLSMSDIVITDADTLNDKAFYVDTFGFKPIAFNYCM